MKTFGKICNVFGILLAWILSIVLVIMLMATPITFTVLSLAEPDTITDVITQALEELVTQETASGYRVNKLSETTQTPMGGNILEDMLGDRVDPEVLEAIMSSNAVKEFLETYTQDFTNAIVDTDAEPLLNAEKLKEIANNNIDEIIDLVRQADPSLTEKDTQKLKDTILTEVNDNAEAFLKEFPMPEQVVEELKESVPELELILKAFAMQDTVKLVVIAFIAALCLLIFLLRLPGFRGFRWLATDLFIGFGFNALICLSLLTSTSAVNALLSQQKPEIAGAVASLLKIFTNGMLVKTGIMLGAAVVLLVVYIIIKKARAKKTVVPEPDIYDIVVLAGQSNAEGQGRGDVAEEYVPDERIMKMNDDFGAHFVTTDGVSVLHYKWPAVNSVAVADEVEKNGVKLGCFALGFAKKYADNCLRKGRKVLIVNANFGGTGFARPEWGVGNIMHERMVSMTQAALAMHPQNRVVAVLWSQGEHDSFENADWDAQRRYATHKENLTATFKDFYEKIGSKDFPIVACGFTDTFCESLPEASEAVLKAIKEVIADFDGGYVDTTGLLSNSQKIGGEDIYHYCKEALHILGEKFFDVYVKIRSACAKK